MFKALSDLHINIFPLFVFTTHQQEICGKACHFNTPSLTLLITNIISIYCNNSNRSALNSRYASHIKIASFTNQCYYYSSYNYGDITLSFQLLNSIVIPDVIPYCHKVDPRVQKSNLVASIRANLVCSRKSV